MKKILLRVLAITVIGILVSHSTISGLAFVKCLINGKVRIHYTVECPCETESKVEFKVAKCCRVIFVKESAVMRPFSNVNQRLNFTLNNLPNLADFPLIQNISTENILIQTVYSHSPPQITVSSQSIVIRDCKLLI